jgi:hypothetical protein
MTNNTLFTGVVEDPRTPAEKALDHLHEEFVATAPVSDPFGNSQILTSPYPDEDQHYVGSCVPHGIGKALAIKRGTPYTRLSWTFAYRLRSNFPNSGSYPQNIFDVYRKNGAPLFTTLPDPFTESQAAAAIIAPQGLQEAAIFKGLAYKQFITPNDIATLAGIAQGGTGVPITIFASYNEWATLYPTVLTPTLKIQDAEINHNICILPHSGFILNGKRYVSIADSAHFANLTLRHVSEDFIAQRVLQAGYWTDVAVMGGGAYPRHMFTKMLTVGTTGPEVAWLQKLLIAENFLPSDCASGYFGGMTLGALHAFQNKHAVEILVPLHLDAPTDTFGSASISIANKLCL